MKKLFVLVFVCVAAITSSFAEFVISPTFGYANLYSQFSDIKNADSSLISGSLKLKTKLNHHAFVVGLDLGGYFANGFSIFINSNFALAGNIKCLTTAKAKVITGLGSIEKEGSINLTLKELEGVSWTSQILLGGTKRFNDDFHLSFLTGLSFGIDYFGFNKIEKNENSVDISALKLKDETAFSYYTVGVPLQLNLAYYFVKHVGIIFSIVEIPSMTIGANNNIIEISSPNDKSSSVEKFDFQNILYVKIGPSFKF